MSARGLRNGWARRAALIPLLGALLGANVAWLAACQDERSRLEEAAEEAGDEVEDAKKELEDEVDDHT